MGDPKKHTKTYSTPSHPYNKERLDKEKEYTKAYGLKNKAEIYKIDSMVRKVKSNAKKLLRGEATPQKDFEMKNMITRLENLGLVKSGAHIDDILTLTVENFFDRRLQSVVQKKGLTSTIKQARQAIIHEHIVVGDKKITSPSYLVTLSEEAVIGFSTSSPFVDEEHPERKAVHKDIKEELSETIPKVDEKRLLEEDVVPEKMDEEPKEAEIKVEETIEDIADIENSTEEKAETEVKETPAEEKKQD